MLADAKHTVLPQKTKQKTVTGDVELDRLIFGPRAPGNTKFKNALRDLHQEVQGVTLQELFKGVRNASLTDGQKIPSDFDGTQMFKVIDEYRVEDIDVDKKKVRDQMLRLLLNSNLPMGLWGLMKKTSRTRLEYTAYILKSGQLAGIKRGGHLKVEPGNIPRADVVGVVHTHPAFSWEIAPPSSGDFAGVDWVKRPIQLVVESDSGRLWGQFKPRHSGLLGRIKGDKKFQRINLLGSIKDLVYRVISSGQQKMEQLELDRKKRQEFIRKADEARRKIFQPKNK